MEKLLMISVTGFKKKDYILASCIYSVRLCMKMLNVMLSQIHFALFELIKLN